MKTLKIGGLCALLLWLCGCTVNYEENYLKDHRDYFAHAFTKYEIITDEVLNYTGTPIPVKGTYRSARIAYQTTEGQTIEFYFDNRDSFEWQLIDHALQRSELEVTEIFNQALPNYTDSDAININYDLRVPKDEEGNNKYNKNMLSGKQFFFFKGKGLRFTDFNCANLQKYDLTPNYWIDYEINDVYGDEEIFKGKLNQAFMQLSELFDNTQMTNFIHLYTRDEEGQSHTVIELKAHYDESQQTYVFVESYS